MPVYSRPDGCIWSAGRGTAIGVGAKSARDRYRSLGAVLADLLDNRFAEPAKHFLFTRGAEKQR
jgi:hypothetical protein